jgi:Tfp pilus assembly protein PilX
MAHRQSGLSLLLALLALMILSLGAVALVRSIDTGTLIAGNVGFKQDAIEASAVGAERAIAWVESHQTDGMLDTDQSLWGYYANSHDQLDPTGSNPALAQQVDWENKSCPNVPAGSALICPFVSDPAAPGAPPAVNTNTPVNGNSLQWVILRLCKAAGVSGGVNPCSQPVSASSSTASERGDLSAGGRISASTAGPYYRVIVRALGPRNTTSFTETIVHF